MLEVIADTFPSADIVVPWNNAPWRHISPRVTESFLARTPVRDRKAVAALVLPAVWRAVADKQKQYDWVLSSSHLFPPRSRTGSARRRPQARLRALARPVHLDPRARRPGQRVLARALGAVLKTVDRYRAQEAHAFDANSAFAKARVERAWRREAVVVHQPDDVQRILDAGGAWHDRLTPEESSVLEGLPAEFVLGTSRFVSYKRLHDLVAAEGGGGAAGRARG